MKRKFGILISVLFCVLLAVCGCSERKEITESAELKSLSFFALNTYVSISASGERADEALAAARQTIERYEDKWSITDNRSELYVINHGGGLVRTIESDTAELIAYALAMAKSTEGALEPTIYPVLTEWGFTTGDYQIPSDEKISELLELVYEKIALDGKEITVPNGMQLDLGAVAKGYIGDLVVQTLKDYGVQSAIVNLGGNIQLLGSRPDNSDWNIGIRSPFESGNFGAVILNGEAIITSGSYERYFIGTDGNRYHHIMDPQTGKPVQNGLASVSIIADDGKLCDALSTACFVMGVEKAIEYWREQGGFDMVLVTENREVFITETVADKFKLNEESGEWKVSVIKI